MRKNGRNILLCAMIVIIAIGLTACKKEAPVEIDRTFEYTTEAPVETTTQKETETTEPITEETPEQSSEEETTTQEETTTKKEEETTTLTGADVYYYDKDSIFSTLPVFKDGAFNGYFNKSFMEGLTFSGVTQEEYNAYVEAVTATDTYSLNSKESTRAYIAHKDGEWCITIIFYDGTMLVEAGKNYWDILTYAENETVEPTKPEEITDSRYDYFDNNDMVFSHVPYFTEGTFTGYSAVDRGGVLTFTDVTQDMVDAYGTILEGNGFMMGGAFENVMYFVTNEHIVSLTLAGTTLTMQVTAN